MTRTNKHNSRKSVVVTAALRKELSRLKTILRKDPTCENWTDEELLCTAIRCMCEEMARIVGSDEHQTQNRDPMPLPYERWRVIPGYEGHYEASNHGRIRSLKRLEHGKPRITKQQCDNGYFQVSLRKNTNKRTERVHRLVALAFIGPPPNDKAHIDHINSDRSDCSARNLRWVSPSENHKSRVRHASIGGVQNPMSQFTAQQIRAIRRKYAAGDTQVKLAREFGVSGPTIGGIVRRKTYRNID
jgi:NUMOD4 motif-containing protein/HNH endonuclease